MIEQLMGEPRTGCGVMRPSDLDGTDSHENGRRRGRIRPSTGASHLADVAEERDEDR